MVTLKRAQSIITPEEPILTTLDFILLTIFVLFLASAASFLVNKTLVVLIFIGIAVSFVYKKKRLNKKAVYLWCIWFLINIIAFTISTKQDFVITTFLGVTLRLMMPFFIVSIIGPDFYNKLNKYIFALVCISTVMYLIDILFPYLFSSLSSSLNFMTQLEQKRAGGFYVFCYMKSGWGKLRNCGFMWEPGAFAAILVFILSYRFSINGFKIDKYIIVYLLALLTTVSTAGYIALFLISIAYMLTMKKHRLLYIIILIPFFLWFSYNYYNSNKFLAEKIEIYQTMGTQTWEWEFEGRQVTRVTRLGIALIRIEESLHWPFGFGILKSKYTLNKYGDIAGPNSLAQILHEWGWPGLLFLIYIIFWFFKNAPAAANPGTQLLSNSDELHRKNKEQIPILLLTGAFCIVLFSNPFLSNT